MNYSDENIGKAFKEAFEGMEIQPSASLWEAVNKANLNAGITKPFDQFSKLIYSITALVVIISAAYFITKNNHKPISENNIIEKVIPITNNTINISVNDTNSNNFTEVIAVSPSNQEVKLAEKPIIVKEEANTIITIASNCNENNIYSDSSAFASIDKMEARYISNELIDKSELISENNITQIADEAKITKKEIIREQNVSELKNDSIINNPFEVSYSQNPIICFGEDALLVAQEGYTYQWNTGERSNQIIVSPIENSYYEVTVTNNVGQTNIHRFAVTIDKGCSALLLPSAFTPNGDGKNDVFKAEGIGISNLSIIVYNSLGQKLFEANNIHQAWDGRFNGELMPPNIYFYQASYIDAKGKNHIKRGQITLIK